MKQLLAFHSTSPLNAGLSPEQVKAKYQTRLAEHHRLDQIVQGFYTQGDPAKHTFRGCAVGCTLHSDDHSAYEDELGIPRVLARLEDGIFEGLLAAEAPQFAVDFLNVIPAGADLSDVFSRFMLWLLVDEDDGVVQFADEGGNQAIGQVAALFQRLVNGEAVGADEWRAAADAADAAAYAAADAAAYAAADAAADAAAYAAADAADAADAAADAAYAAYAAAYAARRKQAQKLLELLASAPILEGVTS